LCSGVGLYGLAIVGTLFIGLALGIIESFEPQTRSFELKVKLGDKTLDQRPRIEQVLRRFKTRYELRGASADEVVYVVSVPRDLHTDRVSTALADLGPKEKSAVEWTERKAKDNDVE
jgi:hypothetical protein